MSDEYINIEWECYVLQVELVENMLWSSKLKYFKYTSQNKNF